MLAVGFAASCLVSRTAVQPLAAQVNILESLRQPVLVVERLRELLEIPLVI
jgi:hypothetical protein